MDALPETVTKTTPAAVYTCKVCGKTYNDLDGATTCSTRKWPGLPVVGKYYVGPKDLDSGVYRCDSVEPYVETTTVNYRTGQKKPTGRPSGTCAMQATFTTLANPWQQKNTAIYLRGTNRSSPLSPATRPALEARLRPLLAKEGEVAKSLANIRERIAQIEGVLGAMGPKKEEV